MNTSNRTEQPEKEEDVEIRKKVKDKRNRKWKLKHRQC
jgi:hypothetical protein